MQTVSGIVEFIWETDQELLVNLEPDRPGAPHTFEVAGNLRDQLADALVKAIASRSTSSRSRTRSSTPTAARATACARRCGTSGWSAALASD